MTQTTDQERAEFEDGAWYWVEKEGWHDEPAEIAPAMYRANSKTWYSYRFGGVPTRKLKILWPCLMQAARHCPPAPVPQGLFEAIEHGDEKHRAWLKAALTAFFAGKPVPREVTHPTQQGLDAQDAARWRWLRNHRFHSASAELGSDLDGAPFVCFVMRVHIPEPISLPYEEQEWTACDTDVAIDAALAAQAKQVKQTDCKP